MKEISINGRLYYLDIKTYHKYKKPKFFCLYIDEPKQMWEYELIPRKLLSWFGLKKSGPHISEQLTDDVIYKIGEAKQISQLHKVCVFNVQGYSGDFVTDQHIRTLIKNKEQAYFESKQEHISL